MTPDDLLTRWSENIAERKALAQQLDDIGMELAPLCTALMKDLSKVATTPGKIRVGDVAIRDVLFNGGGSLRELLETYERVGRVGAQLRDDIRAAGAENVLEGDPAGPTA